MTSSNKGKFDFWAGVVLVLVDCLVTQDTMFKIVVLSVHEVDCELGGSNHVSKDRCKLCFHTFALMGVLFGPSVDVLCPTIAREDLWIPGLEKNMCTIREGG